MNCFVLAGRRSEKDDAQRLEKLPKFRKATENMLLAYSVVNGALEVEANFLERFKKHIGLVLGTSHGELEVSKEFLKGIAFQNVARPILFQNSLHNSTLGFLSQHFGLTGPGITLSNQYFSGEDALETAKLLLENEECSFCLAVGVDSLSAELEPVRDIIYPNGVARRAGAAAFLLANEAGLAKCPELVPRAIVKDIDYRRDRRILSKDEIASRFSMPYYDAGGLENLVTALESEFDTSPVNSFKPDGSLSSIAFERL